MQLDEHVWAWRWYRFQLTGLMLGMLEIGIGRQERLAPDFEAVLYDNLSELYVR